MARALTVAGLARLKQDASKRIERPDGLVPGLYFVIQPSGARSWAVRYRTGGRSRKLTLGTYPAVSLEKAREQARDALVAAKRGGDPAAEKAAQKRERVSGSTSERMGFDSIVRLYIARDAKGNRSWLETARLLGLRPAERGQTDPEKFKTIKDGIVADWGNRLISDIRRGDVVDRLDAIVDRGAPVTANRTLAALRRLFNWAIERGLIEKSPALGVKPPGQERSRDRVLNDNEIRWMWQAANELAYPFGSVVKLLLLTGQRRNEVANITYREIEGDLWTLPRDRAKNDTAHVVPLAPLALEIINSTAPVAGNAGYVFTSTGATPISGWSRFKKSLDAKMLVIARRETGDADLEIVDWTLHDLRRTCASGMASIGIPVHVVEKHLNHRSGTIRGVAAIYNRHDYFSERRAASTAWCRYVMKLISAAPLDNVIALHGTLR